MSPPVLLLIDMQKGFDEIAARVHRNNLEAEGRVLSLLTFWRDRGWPVIHGRHDSVRATSPFRPGHIGNEPMTVALDEPGEPVLRKAVNCAFIGTDLGERLEPMGRPGVVEAGGRKGVCVPTTESSGCNRGFWIILE